MDDKTRSGSDLRRWKGVINREHLDTRLSVLHELTRPVICVLSGLAIRELSAAFVYVIQLAGLFDYEHRGSEGALGYSRLICQGKAINERERDFFLFNDALNTFYLRLYGVRHMVKDHSDCEKGNPLPPHRLLLSINSKGSFLCTIPQTG